MTHDGFALIKSMTVIDLNIILTLQPTINAASAVYQYHEFKV